MATWEKLEEAYSRILDLSQDERDRALNALRSTDPDLAAEVELMLRQSNDLEP